MKLIHHYKGTKIQLLMDPGQGDGNQWYALLDGTFRFTEVWDQRRSGPDAPWEKIEPPEERNLVWPSAQAALAYAKGSIDYERGECDCPDCRKVRQGINPLTGEKL